MIVLLGKRADGDLVFEERSGLCGRDSTGRRPTLRAQQSLGGSDTHGQ